MATKKKTTGRRVVKKGTRMDRMLQGGHAASAVARAVAKCQQQGLAALRAPLANPQWETFALALFASGSITEAAVEAGYSKASAKQQGSRLLTRNVDLWRRVYGLYLEAARSVRRTVLQKGDALVRATARHQARQKMLIPAYRLIGLDADAVGRKLDELEAEGYDVSLVEPVMRLVREVCTALTAEGDPLTTERGAVVTEQRWVSRCESVRFADEREEEQHLGRLMGWYPQPDGTGERELGRLLAVVGSDEQGEGDAQGEATEAAAQAGAVPVIGVPAADEKMPFDVADGVKA